MKRTFLYGSHLVLGLLTTALSVGCGAGADAGGGDPVGAPKTAMGTAAITAVGPPVISGCSGSQAFDIGSPENIQWVAVEGPNVAKMQLQLFNVDEAGNTT